MKSWRYHNPVEVRFGVGAFERVAEIVAGEGLLVVMSPGGRKRGLLTRLQALLETEDFHLIDSVTEYPEIRKLEEQIEQVPDDVRTVIGIGGGSVMDTAKVLGGMVGHRSGEGFLAAVLGNESAPVPQGRVPVIAVPTTAGTGSEVTPFATVWDFSSKRKHSVTGPGMYPRTALIDPELTLTVPVAASVSTGLDALSQALEAIWNRNATAITDAFAYRATQLALESLGPVARAPQDLTLRSRMTEASLLAGLAISHTRTALAHSISYPLTAHFGLPHGLACGFALPAILEFNAEEQPARFEPLVRSLGAPSTSALRDRLSNLLHELGVGEELVRHGVDSQSVSALGAETITPERADNTLRRVVEGDALRLMNRSLEMLR